MDPNDQPEPTLPPAEQMRARRLAKLAAANTASSSSATTESSQTRSSSPASRAATPTVDNAAIAPKPTEPSKPPTININPAPPSQPAAAATGAPSQKPAETKTGGKATPTSVSSGIVRNKAKRTAADIDPASATPPPATEAPAKRPQAESIEDWTDSTLSHLFRLTVDSTRTTDRHGHHLTFLPNLSQELQDRGQPLKLTADDLDAAILEAATAVPHKRPLLQYLLPCWKNVMRALKPLREPPADKLSVLQEAKRLCMSNCIFALTVPELFGREANPEHDTLAPYLLRGLSHDDGICLDFIQEAVARIPDDDTITPIFTNAMVQISNQLSRMTMNDGYQSYMDVLLTYARFKPLVEALAEHPIFQMAQSAPNIEKFTLLGPFFRISPLQPEVAKVYFSGPRTLDKGRIKNAQDALQIGLAAYQTDLHTVAMAFARAGDKPKSRLLDWFAYIMNVNHKRRAMQVNPKEVASDGFMMNVNAVLDRMCEPFMDASFDRMERIDINYLKRQPRIDISDETKLNADQTQSDEFYAKKATGSSNFVSELFFLNLAAHHYGSGSTKQKLKDLGKDIKRMEQQLALLESQRHRAAGNQMTLTLVEGHLKNFTAALERAISYQYAVEGVLSDEKTQAKSLLFMRYVSVWLIRVASQSNYVPSKGLKLPLPDDQPEAFSCLPEYALQNVVDNFKFVFRYVPQIILSAIGDEMIVLAVTFLESSEYIRNPYLKSSLVTLLFSGTWPIYHLRNGALGDALTSTKFANTYLLHSLMKFYIECESTGMSSQFYDKFNIRYEIFQVIKCVWPNDVYKRQLTEQSETNRSFFVRFVNLLLNDATYVLDEALSKFPKIHDLQKELRETPDMPQDTRQQKETELQQAEDQASSYMQLANETVAMMKLFTNALSDAFTMPEIVQRLAGMLDYNLDILAGQKSRQLRVENPEKYHFSPRTLLPELIDIYLNLSGKVSFVEAVANDGRSYKTDTFNNASRILATKGLSDPSKLAAWNALKDKFAKAKEIADQVEQDFGEIPSEFEDPIMGDLMKDPVILPSHHIVDRSTIIQHLLSDPKDPFTRQAMTIEDAIPADDLRERINAWKKEKLAAAKAKLADAMDTTED
ncbi:uncharacterized protein E0L32_003218 [Thyridium curvatum]|uniref:U-box domain-containing protein n=1 Tax=Thyridium curvatum TaxID=1093900 RepID=A0A507BK87_9PEZI|nr:uncharacterized protein E0L32_003218 [Thyridium curvatum]TPX17100.1 hypothetical protein E0L32_003218 [Thyridium curvatum]